MTLEQNSLIRMLRELGFSDVKCIGRQSAVKLGLDPINVVITPKRMTVIREQGGYIVARFRQDIPASIIVPAIIAINLNLKFRK